MTNFKKGDKVRLVRHGLMPQENETWTRTARLKIGEEFIVDSVEYGARPHDKLFIRLTDGEYAGDRWFFHPGHFEYAKKNNAQKIEERRKAHAKRT